MRYGASKMTQEDFVSLPSVRKIATLPLANGFSQVLQKRTWFSLAGVGHAGIYMRGENKTKLTAIIEPFPGERFLFNVPGDRIG